MAEMKKMTIDFWKNYSGPLGNQLGWDRTIREIDKIRFDTWMKANNLNPEETAWSAENLNKMEEWYLNLATVLQDVKKELEELREDYREYGWVYNDALKIINKYLNEVNKDE